MSSNNFIERNILDTKVYAGFYSISNTDWFMVTVLPSPPLIHESNRLMIQIVLIYAVFLVLALIFANVLAHSITGRLSSVIRQMQTVRHGPPTPMESPQAHDEIGNLIDTYNYMTRKMEELMEKQAKAAEDLRIAEFNSLQATDQSTFSLQYPWNHPNLPGTWQIGYCRSDADKSDCLLPTDAEKIKRTDTDQRRTGNCPPVSGNGETLP